MAENQVGKTPAKSRAIFLTVMMILVIFSTISLPPASALDGDGDGIDDDVDDCEFAAGNSTIGHVGCPDDDGDGNANFVGQYLDDWGDTDRELYHSAGSTRAVTWSPDGKYIAGGGSSEVNLYWVGGYLGSLYTITQNVRALEFSPNGSYLAVGGYEEDSWDPPRGWMVVLEMDWATQSATVLVNLSSHHIGDVPSVTWSSNGSYLYTGAEDEIRKFSVEDNWTIVQNYTYSDGNVWALDVSPDDRLIAGTSGGGQMRVFWADNGTDYMEFSNHSTSHALSLKFSPDGRWLLSGGNDNDVHVYNVSNKSWVIRIDTGSDVYGISFDPPGAHFVVARGSSSSTRIYNVSDWTQAESFGSFGTSNNNRGLRAVSWSPLGDAMAFAQRRGRITTHLLPSSYLQVHGDWAVDVLEDGWQSNWPNDGRILKHFNTTTFDATNYVCNNDGSMAALTEGHNPAWIDEDANFSTNGRLDCKANTRSIIEVPIGHIAGVFAVKAGGPTQTCIQTLGGGLSIAQIRWMISSQSGSSLQSGGEYPGIDLSSITPNNDGDLYREWSDLHSSCQSDTILMVHRWQNRSEVGMLKEQFLCNHCTVKDSLYYSDNNGRLRYEYGFGSEIHDTLTAPQGDSILGFAELNYMLDDTNGIFLIPIIDNWTHSAADAINAGGTFVAPSRDNSTNDTWRIQSDLRALVHEDDLGDKLSFLDWSLSDPGQITLESAGYNRLSVLDRVLSWDRIGIDKTYLLPDSDNDGIWDGIDDCTNTSAGIPVDEFGCAEYQLDDDNDGITNDIDDCDNESGNATIPPFVGCLDSDGDGYANVDDAFEFNPTQWRDTDNDTYGDNHQQGATTPDDCIDTFGNSTKDRLGCIDWDGDGWSNATSDWSIEDGADAFPLNATQWSDIDGDGWGDNYTWQGQSDNRTAQFGDAFIELPSQWSDVDGDGFGDNSSGIAPDSCKYISGTSDKGGVIGCIDSDGDGWADSIDELDDNIDQWLDQDGDGFGDNPGGEKGDGCQQTPPAEIADVDYRGCGPSERDTDGDGVNDNLDQCPNTSPTDTTKVDFEGCASAQRDADKDGAFENEDFDDNDATQQSDNDGDGYGDNSSGVNGDDCPWTAGTSTIDRSGCTDTDGDGYSNPTDQWSIEDGADEYPYEGTQWRDSDGDKYGDNWGNSSWNETRDSSSPGIFIVDAYKPDRCPEMANQYALSDGCPEGTFLPVDDLEIVDANAGQSEDGSNILTIVAVAGGLVVVGLFGVVFVLLRKPKSTKPSRSDKKYDWAKGDPFEEETNSEDPELSDNSELEQSDGSAQPSTQHEEEVEIGSEVQSDAIETSEWLQSWEELPVGGEYSSADADGVVWYLLPDGNSWYRNADDSWSLWK